MVRQVNIAEAKAKLSELAEAASRGEEIVLARHGRPLARLVGTEPAPGSRPRLGAMRERLSAPEIEALARVIETPLGKRAAKTAAGAATDDLGLTKRATSKRPPRKRR